MPKLLIFAPCEKVIIDDQKNATLIVLLNTLTVAHKGDAEIPQDAIGSKEWAVFTLWQPTEEDVGKEFVQFLQMVKPDGQEFKRAEIRFTVNPSDKISQARMNIHGFPIGQKGPIILNMWLESSSKKLGEVHSYTVTVVHTTEKDVLSI
jgi:hypothetical protein